MGPDPVFENTWFAYGQSLFFFVLCFIYQTSYNNPSVEGLQYHTHTHTCAPPPVPHACAHKVTPKPQLATHSHCTSVRVSGDDKWRASQSKPICTSIRRGAKWGSTCIFLPAEKQYISAKTLPRGDGIRGRQRGKRGGGGTGQGGTHSTQILGGLK